MGMHILDVRGFEVAVEAKSGSQLAFIRKQMEQRTDEELAQYVEESEREQLEPRREDRLSVSESLNDNWNLTGTDIPSRYRARGWVGPALTMSEWLRYAYRTAEREFNITQPDRLFDYSAPFNGMHLYGPLEYDTSLVPELFIRAVAWRCDWFPSGDRRTIRERYHDSIIRQTDDTVVREATARMEWTS